MFGLLQSNELDAGLHSHLSLGHVIKNKP